MMLCMKAMKAQGARTSGGRLIQFVGGGVQAAALAAASRALTRRIDPPSWQRSSFSGANVQLTGGLDAAIGALGGVLVGLAPAVEAGGVRREAAALVAGSAGAVAGAIDDHLEGHFPARGKGFKGHIGALREGKVTSGLLKIVGVGAGAGVAALLIGSPQPAGAPSESRARGAWLTDVTLNTLLIAGAANFINLLDLRPGRALKMVGVTAIGSGCATGAPAAAGALLGAGAAAAPADLAGQTMLGDLGANALGAQLGVALAAIPSRLARGGVLAAILGLTAISEKVSFSRVINANPALHWVDQLGRPKVAPVAAASEATEPRMDSQESGQ